MDCEFLKENVGTTLATGLAEVVRNNPDDPVDFLSRWLLKQVSDHADSEKQKIDDVENAKLDAEIEREDLEALKLKDEVEKATAKTEKDDAEFEEYVKKASDQDELLDRWVSYIQNRIAATAVYIADYDTTVEPVEPPDEDEENAGGDGDGDEPAEEELPGTLKYRAAWPEDHKFMLEEQLGRKYGVSHDLFQDEPKEEEEEEAEDGGDEAANEEITPLRRQIYAANILQSDLSDRIHFFRSPRPGAFLAVRAEYDSLLNEEALVAELPPDFAKTADELAADAVAKEAAAKEAAAAAADEGDEADAAPPEEAADAAADAVEPPPTKSMQLAVGMDTLGQNRPFTDGQIALVTRSLSLLESALARIDKVMFLTERAHRTRFLESQTDAQTSEEDREKQLEELKQELGEDTPDDELKFRNTQKVVATLRAMLQEFKSYHVFKGPLRVLQCVFYMLDFKKDQVADGKNKPVWKKMRMIFGDNLFHRLNEYDPSAEQKRKASESYAKVKSLKKLLKGLTYEEIKGSNYPLAELFNYATDALSMKEAAKQRREEAEAARKAAEEEAAKQAAEEEAAKKAADEEAAAEAETAEPAEGDAAEEPEAA
eukprot:887568_1